ncbi:MAG: hypothetical protein ABI641_06470 [Caldimonas sp.]
MAARPPTGKAPHLPLSSGGDGPRQRETHRSLRWVRDVLGRSIGLSQRREQLHDGLVEHQRIATAEPLSLLTQQRADLGARLLVHDPATQAVRHLFVVHDELGARGWQGVADLPLPVMARALTEAEILDSQESSPMLATIIERLRELMAAADARQAVEALDREFVAGHAGPEVSETNFDEFELMERSWMGTVPAGLELPRSSRI